MSLPESLAFRLKKSHNFRVWGAAVPLPTIRTPISVAWHKKKARVYTKKIKSGMIHGIPPERVLKNFLNWTHIFSTALAPYELMVNQLPIHINYNFLSPIPTLMAKKKINKTALLQTRSVSVHLTNELYSRSSLLRMYVVLPRE